MPVPAAHDDSPQQEANFLTHLAECARIPEGIRMTQNLDATDVGIVSLLQRDGRLPNIEIARQLGVAEGTVRKRLERLLDDGVLRVVGVPDPAKAGYPVETLMGIQVELGRATDVARRLAEMPEVRLVAISTGAYDIFVSAVFASGDQVLEFLTEKVAGIAGVRRTETFHVLKVVKRISDWRLPGTDYPPAPKILVVDDDESFVAIVRTVLSRSGFRVVSATSAREGLEKVERESPDLILLDYVMATPGEGGLFASLLRRDGPNRSVPILMVTAMSRHHPWWKVQEEMESLPVDGWMEKPIDPDRLVQEVERLLAGVAVVPRRSGP